MRLCRRILRPFPLLVVLCAAAASAQSPPAAARELGRRILAVTGPRPRIVLSFENHSSAGVADAAALRGEIEAALRGGGARFVKGGAKATRVAVTLSESWRNLLLVARVGKGNRVVMVTLRRMSAAAGAGEPVVSLSRRIVWRQRAPFLSFLEWQSPADKSSYLWILEPGRLVLYRQQQGQWRWRGAADIERENTWPRDLRGLLWIEPPSPQRKPVAQSVARLRVSLPGVECRMPLPPGAGKLPLACGPAAPGSREFPIFQAGAVAANAALVAGRNFFSAGVERGGASVDLHPFYSATIVNDDRGDPMLLAAALDGKTYLYDDAGKVAGTVDGWGSDVAGVETACGSGWQVLATRPGDWTANDSLAAYEVVDGKPVATGEPIDFPGPVTALWPEPGGEAAAAVVLDLGAGFYDAYTVTLSCGR